MASTTVREGHSEESKLLTSTTNLTYAASSGDENEGSRSEGRSPFETQNRTGSASVPQTVINLAKTCCGTGCLALPYAAQQGGILLNGFGIVAIALWNTIALQRLCDCYDVLASQHELDSNSLNQEKAKRTLALVNSSSPPPGTATFGRVAWYILGPSSLHILDTIQGTFFIGIVVAYQALISSFLQDTPFTTHSNILDSIAIAFIMAPLSIVPDMGYLARASALGLTVLMLTLLVIAGYGFTGETKSNTLSLFPHNGIEGASNWFGCIVFGFGVAPLTYNFRESMESPQRLVEATCISMLGVSVFYIVVGMGLALLFPGVNGEILHEIPDQGILPVITRLAMLIVVLVTAPLLIVPCGELIEGKLFRWIPTAEGQQTHPSAAPFHVKVIVRFGICLISAVISVGYPGFVQVLSFVGSFCVALVGFCIPPLLHALLLWKSGSDQVQLAILVDVLLLAWGITATCISTLYTIKLLDG